MKKLLILITMFSLLGLGVLPVLAEETTSATAQSAPEVYKGAVVLYGDLTAKSSPTVPSDLTVTIKRIQGRVNGKGKKAFVNYPVVEKIVTVHVTADTNIVRKYMGKADLSELAVGDKLMVVGKLQEDGSVNANLVKDESIQVTFQARNGEVTSIDITTQTFNIKNDNKEYKIFVTANTKFAKVGIKLPTFADLKVGDKVVVRGVIRQVRNEITADSVVIRPNMELQKLQQEKIRVETVIAQMKQKLAEAEKRLAEIIAKLGIQPVTLPATQ
ncbi:MAG TPA: hypothetical protein DEB73_03985 [Candidatus Magasanikbacteria bacterium]|uniref:DUF5666 domain-containing protein n=2 Tax=Candidatus Magasanikiibacteriota TaxID=1752731 RepID=A0A0G0ZY78_9BACT|nr:MAG: hypothetical protein UU49_C0030G0014 [Candidatus Magasanikbacteria bacterium GW2011_GWC2_41_17]KKS53622.1 MAG: hypothetical protein UV20_C0048G0015 [Candidatus Magasanikbacteria bacterium GW2011_GWA2_42_32]HBV58387.1 hypothetical protein [Candidatus Magasanikbacteria bacterium]HBX16359.1 hypothetical protein [Candidatus Magasanikbacteria bacterium]